MFKFYIIACFVFWAFIGLINIIKEARSSNRKAIQKKKEITGSKWEDQIAHNIEKTLKIPVHRNVLIPTKTPIKNTECDIVFVTPKGVFCTECKYKGKVGYAKCNINDEYNDLIDHNGMLINERNSSYTLNPIYQNKKHINWLRSALPVKTVPIFNYIYTNYGFELNYMGKVRKSDEFNPIDLLASDERLFVGNVYYLKDALKRLPDVLSADDITLIRHALDFYTATDKELLQFKERISK